jgi:nucleoside-diphosphate-sugar epimerase
MASCLVTGVNGFVGTNLAQWLRRRDWKVRGLIRSQRHQETCQRLDVEPVLGALDDAAGLERAVADVEAVFHVAGRTRALKPAEFHRDNVEGTRHLVEACARRTSPPVVVIVSSLAAGGTGLPARPRCESDEEAPLSRYGRSKLAAEQAAAGWAGEVPISIVRPPIIFGPHDLAGLTMYRGMKFFPIHPTPGLRAFPVSIVYVEDLCAALEGVAQRGERLGPASYERDRSQGKYYVTAQRDITYGEMGKMGARAAGWAVAAVPMPMVVFWAAGLLGEVVGRALGSPAVVNLDKSREAAAPGWVCSGSKISQQLGIRPTQSLEDRFAQTVAWYRQHEWL